MLINNTLTPFFYFLFCVSLLLLFANAEINFPYFIRVKQCRGTIKVQDFKYKILTE